MSRLDQIGLSRKSLASLLGALFLLALFGALTIFPALRELESLRAKSQRLEGKIEAQEILTPVYISLQEKLKQEMEIEKFIREKEQEITPSNIDKALEILFSMAQSSGLDKINFSLEPGSLSGDSDLLLMTGELSGQYQDFQDFFLQLIAWEHLDHLEQIEIQGQEASTGYKLRFWVSID